jgi:peptidoglycan/xylan/chitin deacetylase (PgdA/CDA1 family)
MPRAAVGFPLSGAQTLIDGISQANFSELSGAGATKTTDSAVTFNGAATTRVFVPSTLTTNFEIGVTTASVNFPGYVGDPLPNRLGIIIKTDAPARITGISVYVGDASYTNFGISTSEAGNLPNGTDWGLMTAANAWAKTGSPTFSGARRTKVRVLLVAGPDCNVWVAGFYALPAPRAAFCLICDDAYDEHYSYLRPACLSRGVPVSISVPGGLIGGAGHMTNAQCREIAADSSGLIELVNHSMTNTSYVTQGLPDYVADVNRCRDYLRSIGAEKGADYHVYVQGFYDQTLVSALIANGYKGAREVGASNRSFNRPRIALNPRERYALPASCNLEDTQPLATVQGYIDNAIAVGGTFVAMGHRFDTTAGTIQWTEADMNALLDFVVRRCKQGLLDLYKFTDLIDVYAAYQRATN